MIGRLEKEVDVLDRHLNFLKTGIANERIGIIKMSDELGYPHHKVLLDPSSFSFSRDKTKLSGRSPREVRNGD